MISDIVIFGRTVPLYGIFFFGGIILASITAVIIAKKILFPVWEIVYSAIYTMIGAIIGSKLLFIAVSIKDIIRLNLPVEAVIKGGFVFYGGLIGGAAGLFIYCKIYKEKMLPYLELYSVVLPLGHAFGRVGCFFAGCCYGIPYKHGVIYHSSAGMTPLNTPLLPIQLIEACALLILFTAQLVILFKKKSGNTNTLFYIIAYPVLRFIIEFFRGDAERGKLFGLSTSQYVSILIVVSAVLIIVAKRKKQLHPRMLMFSLKNNHFFTKFFQSS